ncbi:MAG: hypothetical protein KDE22_14205 [Rhodobacterales bacterium]|nr:hypothetical protein [Rhodobacterales bacterium]
MPDASDVLGSCPHTSGSDQPVAPLTERQKLLLWSVRLWAAGQGRRAFPCRGVQAAFQRAGVAEALAPLGRVLATVAVHAHRTLWLRPVCSAHMSRDERSLLDLFLQGAPAADNAARQDRMARALALLMAEDAARGAAPAAVIVADIFARAEARPVVRADPSSPRAAAPARLNPSPRPAGAWLN